MTDNFEFEDIDIMEIDFDLSEPDAGGRGRRQRLRDVAREGVVSHGNFQGSFLHDMVVKKIGRT